MKSWRLAHGEDDAAIVEMCAALNAEDPGVRPVPAAHVTRTLEVFRREPTRGLAVILEVEGVTQGYAFLASFWSNEVGGEICYIDELYVRPASRGRGYATQLITSLIGQESSLWPRTIVAVDLEVTPSNARARALYTKLGFSPAKNQQMRFRF
jgi:ribosomal protein S18 acetylase RimI-like enzyme